MNYNEAIRRLYKKYGKDGLDNAYLSFSIISDYVKADHYQKRLTSIYFILNKDNDLFQIFYDKGIIDGREYFKNIYKSKYKNTCKVQEYMDVLNPISEIACPNDYKNHQPKKREVVQKVIIKKKAPAIIHRLPTVPVDYKPTYDLFIKGKCPNLSIKLHRKSTVLYVDNKTKKELPITFSVDSRGKTAIDITATELETTLYLPDRKYKQIEISVNARRLIVTSYKNEKELRVKKLFINRGVEKELKLSVKSEGKVLVNNIHGTTDICGEYNKLSVICDGYIAAVLTKTGDELTLISNKDSVLVCLLDFSFRRTLKEIASKNISRWISYKNHPDIYVRISVPKNKTITKI